MHRCPGDPGTDKDLAVTHHTVRLDPDFHNGVEGTVLRDADGEWEGNQDIDTTQLAEGTHRLFWRSDCEDPRGSTLSGILMVTFRAGASSDPEPSPSGIVFRGASSGTTSGKQGRSTTLELPTPVGVVAGDMLVASLAVTGAPAITAPAGWSEVRSDVNGTSMEQGLYYRVAPGNEPFSYRWTVSEAQNAAGGILTYAGVDAAAPIEAHSGLAGAGTSIGAPSADASAMVVGVYGIAGNASISPPPRISERAEDKSSRFVAWEGSDSLQEQAGETVARVATASRGYDNIGQLAVLRPAG